jgi:hypothetical protein
MNGLLLEKLNTIKKKMNICNELKKVQEITDPKIIAETIWMADRPRTWWEWFSWTFYRRLKYFYCSCFHLKNHQIIAFYSNYTHRYRCNKCEREFDE